MSHKNILHAKFHNSNKIIEEFENVTETRIKYMKILQAKNVRKLFFLHGLIFIKGNRMQKNSQFCWILFKKWAKYYFLLPKIFELLPANLNFSQIPEDFQI